MSDRDGDGVGIEFGSPAGRWVLAAAVLGSGIAFLDSTVVNVALPAIRRDLHASVTGLQWVLDGYLVTLTALLLLGGSLGDRVGRRRVFVAGLVGFVAASALCGAAPGTGALIVARVLQGAAAAFLVPGSLAIISASFREEDRARAVGAWSGLAGAASAIGPFVGGWLIDAASWRLVFFLNLPLAGAAIWIASRRVPETSDTEAGPPDLVGAVTISAALAGITYALIEARTGARSVVGVAAIGGVVCFAVFMARERAARDPMLPLELFRSRQFTGANLTTLAVYAALGGALFLLVLDLQLALHYSALAAGTSLLPFTLVMLALSSRAGELAQRVGPRVPMTVGPFVTAGGLVLLARTHPGVTYPGTVLPGVLVFALGMTLTVAPLTAAVLAAADEHHLGVASGVNNAVARLAGLLAVAVLPGLVGIDTGRGAVGRLVRGFPTALRVSAAVCAAGGMIAFATIRSGRRVRVVAQSGLAHPCQSPCLAESDAA